MKRHLAVRINFWKGALLLLLISATPACTPPPTAPGPATVECNEPDRRPEKVRRECTIHLGQEPGGNK